MVDRQNLTDKAKSVGKSVAGTLGEKAQQLKQKAETLAKDPDTGIEISEVNGQYLVIDGDGNATGPFDNRRNAAAKAREMKREMEDEDETDGKAAEFSQKVNETAGKAKDKLQSAGESIDTDGESGGSPTLPGMEADDGGGPTLPGMESESGEPSLPFMQEESGDGPSMPFMEENDGEQPSLPFMEDQTDEDGPELPFMTDSDSDEEPRFPGF
jgi:hypothetical protein